MTTVAAVGPVIGTGRLWRPISGNKDVLVEVKVLDVRQAPYGRVDVQLMPVAGSGTCWVDVMSTSPLDNGG